MEIKEKALIKLNLSDKIKDKAIINVTVVSWQYLQLGL